MLMKALSAYLLASVLLACTGPQKTEQTAPPSAAIDPAQTTEQTRGPEQTERAPTMKLQCPTSVLQSQVLEMKDGDPTALTGVELSSLEVCSDGRWYRSSAEASAQGQLAAAELDELKAAFAVTTLTAWKCPEADLDYLDRGIVKMHGFGRSLSYVRCPESVEEQAIVELLAKMPWK